LRDRLLGHEMIDIDVVIDGDAERAARAIAHAAGKAACFPLSERFGAWRIVAHDKHWQVDVERLCGQTLQEDLARRDFTVNAIAEPLQGGELIDPLGGRDDLAASCLRAVSGRAFADDPLRVLRLVRIALERSLRPDAETLSLARAHAGALKDVSAERIFMELRRVIAADDPIRGLALMDELGLTPVLLPELHALQGVRQSRFHHLDVHDHTLEVLRGVLELQRDPAAVLGAEHAAAIARLLDEPLADELTRGDALRWGALLHDAAKPATREVRSDGWVTFIGHDTQGARLASALLGRLHASTRLRKHVASLAQHHLRLGFLVHEPQPLARETVFAYLRACEPVEVDVTLLSVADRLATRGERSSEAIDAHMRLARQMLNDALAWREHGPPKPPLRGDELARELGIETGPRIGALLEELTRAQYAGKLTSRTQALEYARALLAR
jgi:putative nucleotidyltransferase with HDIG domain